MAETPAQRLRRLLAAEGYVEVKRGAVPPASKTRRKGGARKKVRGSGKPNKANT